jgi:hypothetical protein
MAGVSRRLNADSKAAESVKVWGTEMDMFGEHDFKERVASAIQKARTVLTLGTNLGLPEDVPHAYSNKYELAEALGCVSLAALVNVLEVLGLNGKTLRVLREWAEERAVTLRFGASLTGRPRRAGERHQVRARVLGSVWRRQDDRQGGDDHHRVVLETRGGVRGVRVCGSERAGGQSGRAAGGEVTMRL